MEFNEQELTDFKYTIEAALLASTEPLSVSDIKRMFNEDLNANLIKDMLRQIAEEWSSRSGEVVEVASGWRIQVRTNFQARLDKLEPQRPPKYSRAVLETLAIIAYKQPVTRGDIEDVRGVAVSPNILRTLEARGWIDQIGVRETPGRPALFGTTETFLNDLGLKALGELPPLDDLGELLEESPDMSEQMTLDVEDSGKVAIDPVPVHEAAGSQSIN
ncbi:MAG: SMC-Scp complex subunit ScpB [Betaproteobacteria bacterium]|nr:SMC-Scp complex subunit ScpB [Betaproteobacteria bacterium]MBT6411434.1 SMC-Scp complex subunit ScpB [Betaproteobacteria bacterium]